MPLPGIDDRAEDFSDNLAYFAAKLAADPDVSAHAAAVRAAVDAVDAGDQGLRRAGRVEVEARAARDFIDDKGDEKVRAFRRRLAGETGQGHAILKEVFPEAVAEETRPVGQAQAERWRELLRRCGLALQDPALGRDANAEKIRQAIEEGRTAVAASLEALEAALERVQQASDAQSLARVALKDAKEQALLGARRVLGELISQFGDERRAYSYTMPAAKRSGKKAEEETAGNDAPSAAVPEPPASSPPA